MTDTRVLPDVKSLSDQNGNPGFHTQDLMRIIRHASNAVMREIKEEKGTRKKDERPFEIRVMEKVEEKIPGLDKLGRAITFAFIRGSEDQTYYEVKGNEEIKDFRFSLIKGKGEEMEGDNIVKAPHNLTTRNIFHERCEKHHKLVPLIEIYLWKKYQNRPSIGWILICDQIQLTGKVSYSDLQKEK